MLSIANLSKTYPSNVPALVDVTLEIGPGLFGLLGPNGAGKSTLMRTIAALQQPSSGRILFNGIDCVHTPEAIRAELGYLPQEFGVYPRVSAFKLLDYLAVLKGVHHAGERKSQVHALLGQTNLWEVRNKAVSTFSGGMRQRFGIAQALLGNPQLIIVDEPTAGLDPQERRRFLNLLSDVAQSCTVILSTHIVEDVAELCSHMAILNRGRLLCHGQPLRLIADLEGQVWQKTMGKQELLQWEGKSALLSTRLRSGKPQVRVLNPSQPGPGFEPAAPTLEDVYLATLNRQQEGLA